MLAALVALDRSLAPGINGAAGPLNDEEVETVVKRSVSCHQVRVS